MMNKSKLTVPDFLHQCSLRINNSINDASILRAVSKFGYTSEKIETGKILLDSSLTLNETFNKEYGDVTQAFADRNSEKEKADDSYKKFLTIAQIALKNDYSAKTALQLSGRRATSFSGWLNQVRNFYNNLLNNEQWLASMLIFGITPEILNEGLSELNQVESYAEIIMREKGDAQNATAQRDHKLDELDEWVSDYEKIAEIALMDSPQLLEKLGIVVK